MSSWSEVVDFSQVLTSAGGDDTVETFRVMSDVPVIVFDREARKRHVVKVRWGFPKPGNWKVPQPIHARSERIDETHPHKYAFQRGQRGIVLAKTFNEAPDIPGKSIQRTITPGDTPAVGFAYIWDRFEIGELPAPLLAGLMVTVPANKLIATLPTDRMPAVLANEDWSVWLGETDVHTEAVKAALRTVEDNSWIMEREGEPPRQGSLF